MQSELSNPWNISSVTCINAAVELQSVLNNACTSGKILFKFRNAVNWLANIFSSNLDKPTKMLIGRRSISSSGYLAFGRRVIRARLYGVGNLEANITLLKI